MPWWKELDGGGGGGSPLEGIRLENHHLNLEWSCFLVLNFWTLFLQQGLKNSLSLKSLGKHSSLWVVGLNLSQRWGPRFHTDQSSVPRYHKPSQDLVLDFLRTSPSQRITNTFQAQSNAPQMLIQPRCHNQPKDSALKRKFPGDPQAQSFQVLSNWSAMTKFLLKQT